MSYYFKLPQTNELTPIQNDAIISSSKNIKIHGGPGTGKSVVCIYKHIQNLKQGKSSMLLTYTKTLEYALSNAVKQNGNTNQSNVGRILRDADKIDSGRYQEIIIDEGQDVGAERFVGLKRKTKSLIFAGDFNQSLYLNDESLKELKSWVEEDLDYEEDFVLQQNFRTPREILEFVKREFPDFNISQSNLANAKPGIAPNIISVDSYDFDDEMEIVYDILNDIGINTTTENIAILLPSANLVNRAYKYLDTRGVPISYYTSDDGVESISAIKNIHVTTYKSSKGLEFDHVIIPKYSSKNWFINNTSNFSEKDYFVALTRTSRYLYIIK